MPREYRSINLVAAALSADHLNGGVGLLAKRTQLLDSTEGKAVRGNQKKKGSNKQKTQIHLLASMLVVYITLAYSFS